MSEFSSLGEVDSEQAWLPKGCQPSSNTRSGLLALCKRERTKVRDFRHTAPQVQTRLPAKHHPDFHKLRYSRSAERECRPSLGTLLASDRDAFPRKGRVRNHPARRPDVLPGSRSQGCRDRSDVVFEICGEAHGCASVARGFAQTALRCAVDSGGLSSLGGLAEFMALCEISLFPPHLCPLPGSGGEEEEGGADGYFWGSRECHRVRGLRLVV